MSLWFRRRDKNGTVHLVSVPFEPLTLVALVGITVAIMVPFLLAFRGVTTGSPGWTLTVIVATLAVGFATFATAKISVIRSGRLVSFGPRLMSRPMQLLYIVGYVLLAIGASLAILFALVAHTLH